MTQQRVTLGKAPKTFKKEIKTQLLDGTDAFLTLDFIYRTRKEFGKFIDDLAKEDAAPKPIAAEPAAAEVVAPVKGQYELYAIDQIENTAGYILKIASGWDMASPFTRDTVDALCDEFPGVAANIAEGYRQAINEGRLGN